MYFIDIKIHRYKMYFKISCLHKEQNNAIFSYHLQLKRGDVQDYVLISGVLWVGIQGMRKANRKKIFLVLYNLLYTLSV